MVGMVIWKNIKVKGLELRDAGRGSSQQKSVANVLT